MADSVEDPWDTSFPHLTTDGDDALAVTASADASETKTLPFVLAGPILRRVTNESVAVWVATHGAADVKLTVSSGQSEEGSSGWESPLSVGSNLHVTVVETSGLSLSPGTTYEYDLAFRFSGDKPPVVGQPSGNHPTLGTSGVLAAGENGLDRINAEESDSLPSFAIPPKDKNNLRLFHASCRKPHGKKRGVLSAIRKPIENNLQTPSNRPHSLFLTGDQIYADDVADTFFTLLWNAGRQLLGKDEKVPLFEDKAPVKLKALRPDQRQSFANNNAGMTTSVSGHKYGTSHLFGLSEYFAMYVAVWSDVLWPTGTVESSFPDLKTVWDDGSSIPLHVFETIENRNDNELPTWLADDDGGPNFSRTLAELKDETKSSQITQDVVEEAEEEYKNSTKRLQFFKDELPDVRRVLANVPTYMMWDDHEVTDDWFLNGNWVESVLSTPLGHTGVQNGMIAANVCQMWGNQPTSYVGERPGAKLLDKFGDYVNRDLDGETSKTIDDRLGMPRRSDAKDSDIYAPVKWNRIGVSPLSSPMIDDASSEERNKPDRITYHLGLYPGQYGIGMLDTRTWRGYASGDAAPELISSLGQRTQLDDIEETFGTTTWYDVEEESWNRSKPLFLVNAVPLWTLSMADLGQEWMKHLPRRVRNKTLQARDVPDSKKDWDIVPADPHADFEHWRLQPAAMESMLHDAARLSKYVITLSGDVHYGFTTRTEYWHNYDNNDYSRFSTRFANLTASAAKNESFLTNQIHPVGYAVARANAFGGWYHETAPQQIADWSDYLQNKRWALDQLDPAPHLDKLDEFEVGPSPTEIVDRYIYELGSLNEVNPTYVQAFYEILKEAANIHILKTDSQATTNAPWNSSATGDQIITTEYVIQGTHIDYDGLVNGAAIWWNSPKKEGFTMAEVPVPLPFARTGTWDPWDNKPLFETVDAMTFDVKYVTGDIVIRATGPSDPYVAGLMREYHLHKIGATVVSWADGNELTQPLSDSVKALRNGWEVYSIFGNGNTGSQSTPMWIYSEIDALLAATTQYGGVEDMLTQAGNATIKHLEQLEKAYNWGLRLLLQMQRGAKPHWEYRVDFLRGHKETKQAWKPSSSDPVQEWNRFEQYRDYGSEVVGRNNVGEVTLDWGEQDLTFQGINIPNKWRFVNHKLWWRMGGTAEAHPYTEFNVNMLSNALGVGGAAGVGPPSRNTAPTGNISSRPSDLIQGAVDLSPASSGGGGGPNV